MNSKCELDMNEVLLKEMWINGYRSLSIVTGQLSQETPTPVFRGHALADLLGVGMGAGLQTSSTETLRRMHEMLS